MPHSLWAHRFLQRRTFPASLLILLTLGVSTSGLLGCRDSVTTTLRGQVLHATTGNPIAKVAIDEVDAIGGTYSDDYGRFSLDLFPRPVKVRATRQGYVPKDTVIDLTKAPPKGLRIVLRLAEDKERQRSRVLSPPLPGDTIPIDPSRFATPDSARVGYRQLQFQGFDGKRRAEFTIQLSDDLIISARAEEIRDISAGHFHWIGRVFDEYGSDRGRATFVYRDSFLVGDIHFSNRFFKILPLRDRLHVALEIDLTLLPPDLPPAMPPESGRPPSQEPHLPTPNLTVWGPRLERLSMPAGNDADNCSDLFNLTTGPFHEIRLLVLYSDQVKCTIGGEAILGQIELMVLNLNLVLRESDVPVHVALARASQLSVPDTREVYPSRHLDSLEIPREGGAYEAVPRFRDESYSDLVVLLLANIHYGGKANTMRSVDLTQGNRAFAVVKHLGADGSSFAHEIGHLLGGQHERGSGYEDIYMRPYHYNHGYDVPDQDWVTLMAAPDKEEGEKRIYLLSNPSLYRDGVPLGLPSTHGSAADVHRAFRNTASVVSAFRLTPVWFASAGASGPWFEKRISQESVGELRFGDFDGDRETDAFRLAPETNEWWWSRSASEDWRVLNAFEDGGLIPLDQLAFGDFDGDGTTDVFRADVEGGGWWWSKGGSEGWAKLDTKGLDGIASTCDLAFGDFDGDGSTDVFLPDPSSGEWFYWSGGTGERKTLGESEDRKGLTLSDLAFGDFDGDGFTDVLTTTGQSWLVSYGGKSAWKTVREDCHRLPSLAFGDFDGDGTTDVLRTGIRP